MNVLVIGKPKYNVILESESFPKENEKIKVNERLEISAGPSVYVACMLAKWGIPVYYAGAVSGDEIGSKIKTEIESFGVDTKFMELDYEHHSSINYVLLNKATGSSTEILHDSETYLKKYKYDILPDYIITDGSDLGASIAASNNYPKAKMILLANKASQEYIDLSKRCSYVCANMNFAEALTKMQFEFNRNKSLVNLFQKIKDLNKAEYILMLREKGVLYTNNRQVKMIPAVTIEKKDDANSGSSFFATYCYGILRGLDMDTIAKTSNIAGALALTKIGSLNTIPDKEEVFTTAGVKDEPVNTQAPSNNNQASTQVNTTQTLTPETQAPATNEVQSNNAPVNNNQVNATQTLAPETQAPVTNQVQNNENNTAPINNTQPQNIEASNMPIQNNEMPKINQEGLSNNANG